MELQPSREPSELFHYTTLAGLDGILNTQTLWATHFRFTNDIAEVMEFKERLPELLLPDLTRAIEDIARGNPKHQAAIKLNGGMDRASKEASIQMTAAIYNTWLGNETIEPYGEPYLTSFCAHTNEDILRDGLLSQWRGYGKDGGYALVFDASKLKTLVDKEREKWGAAYLTIGYDTAVYSNYSSDRFHQELGPSVVALSGGIRKWITSGFKDNDALQDTLPGIIQCACRYKNGGFSEEQETRIVAMPASGELLKEHRAAGKVAIEKSRRHIVRNGVSIPYVNLFEGIADLSKPLPISRIIIGPHGDKERRARSIEELLNEYGLDIHVSTSRIPYVAR